MIGRLRILSRVLEQSFIALWAFKLRSLFVILATALGIASLTIIVASVDGAQRKAVEITQSFGPDAAFVLGGDIFNRAVGMRTLTLSWDDARALRQSLPGAYMVVPMRARRNVKARFGNNNLDVQVLIGATENYADAWNWPLAEGRDISAQDVARSAKVCLLAHIPATELFDGESPLGQTIFIQNIPFQVVGTLVERGVATGGGSRMDSRIVIPLTTLTQRFNMDRKYYRALRVKFIDSSSMDANAENLRSFLRELHNLKPEDNDDFTVLTADEVLKFLSMLKGGLVAFLGVTATVAILVGGFVLANLFYLSVTERRHEIGIRRSFGARSSAILLQFLAEAVTLTVLGALLGLALGLLFGELLDQLGILEIKLSVKVFVLALASSVAIGIVFGLRPARQAARIDPIGALKG